MLKAAVLATLLALALIGPAALFVVTPAHAERDGDRDRDGDDSGHGGGGGDDSGDGGGGGEDNGGHGGGDDDDDDDGHGGGDDDDDAAAVGGGGPDWNGPRGNHGRIVRIEVRGGAIEVRYADGARERIASGRYEFRDASGRTERRTATGADIARLQKIARDAGAMPAAEAPQQARVERYEMRQGGIALYYSNGWTESVEGGIYTLSDPFNRAITRRAATGADLDRLIRLAGS